MNADGSGVHAVTYALGLYYSPSWSPDGSQLAYAGQNGPDVGIYVDGAEGPNAHLLGNTLPSIPISPAVAWSPDGARELFATSHGLAPRLYGVDANGAQLAALAG